MPRFGWQGARSSRPVDSWTPVQDTCKYLLSYLYAVYIHGYVCRRHSCNLAVHNLFYKWNVN